MTDNPYLPPRGDRESPTTGGKSAFSVLLATSKYAGAYLLGILSCVAFTDADLHLAGKNLLPWYLFLSAIGVVLWFIAAFQDLPSPPFEMWWVLTLLVVPCAGEALVFLNRTPRVRCWRPRWIGLPVGFVGTLGIYWAGSLSI